MIGEHNARHGCGLLHVITFPWSGRRTATISLRLYQEGLIVLCVLPMLLVSVVMTAEALRRVDERQNEELNQLALRAVQVIDADVQRRVHGLQTVALQAHRLQLLDFDSLYQQARAYDQAFGSPVFVARADTQVLMHSREALGKLLPRLPVATKRSALSQALQTGQLAVSDVITGNVVKRRLISLVQPIGEHPSVIALGATVEAQSYERLLQALNPPAGWGLALIDSADQVVAHYRLSADVTSNFLMSPVRANQREWSLPMHQAPWRIAVRVDNWSYYAPHLQLGGMLLLAICLTVGSTVFAARRSSLRLRDAMSRLATNVTPGETAGQSQDQTHGVSATHILNEPGPPAPRLQIAEIEEVRKKIIALHAARAVAQERERKRVARDLHDGLQQNLAAIRIQIDLELARAMTQGADVLTIDGLREASLATQSAIEELDRIVNDLRPPVLDALGLRAAVTQLATSLSRTARLNIELDFAGQDDQFDALPEEVTECLYRLVQEALTNVRKHAQASFVYLLIDASDGHQVLLQVSDDGLGVHHEELSDSPGEPGLGERRAGGSFGLLGMSERVAALGGWLRVRSKPRTTNETNETSASSGASTAMDEAATEFATTVFAALPLRGGSVSIDRMDCRDGMTPL